MRCAAPWKYLLRISGGKRRRRVVRPRKTKDGRPIPSNPEMRSHAIAAMLKGADRRSIGRSNRSEEHTSELQSQSNLVCRLLLEKKKKNIYISSTTGERQHQY